MNTNEKVLNRNNENDAGVNVQISGLHSCYGGKGKIIRELNHRTIRSMGEWRNISTILKPRRYVEMSGQLHGPVALPHGNSPRSPVVRGLGGPQGLSGCYGEEQNLLSLSRIESSAVPDCSLVAIPAKLHVTILQFYIYRNLNARSI